MSETHFFYFVYFWIALAVIVGISLLKYEAPYGKHFSQQWGPLIGSRAGWILMEIVALLGFVLFFFIGLPTATPLVWIFFACWVIHYVNRSIIFPLRYGKSGQYMPLLIVLMAIVFNSINGFINGYYLTAIAPVDKYTLTWLSDPRFIIGMGLFIIGMAINLQSDRILRHLRKPGETGYKIPKGGLFRYISCPNYFGEILEWVGFAIMTWSLPALAFALWTIANLLPRALSYHRWYHEKFSEYPKQRKAVLPFIF